MTVRHKSLAVIAALSLSLPAISAAAPARGPSPSGTQLGGFIGLEDGDGDTGFALRLDGELPYGALAPEVGLSFVGSFGFSRWDYGPRGFFTADWDANLSIFKFVPAVRFSFGRSPVFRPYADAGLGLYYARFSEEFRDAFGQRISDSASDVGLMMRFAGGILFQLSPTFSLGGEIGFTPYFGDVDDTTFTLMFGALVRL